MYTDIWVHLILGPNQFDTETIALPVFTLFDHDFIVQVVSATYVLAMTDFWLLSLLLRLLSYALAIHSFDDLQLMLLAALARLHDHL